MKGARSRSLFGGGRALSAPSDESDETVARARARPWRLRQPPLSQPHPALILHSSESRARPPPFRARASRPRHPATSRSIRDAPSRDQRGGRVRPVLLVLVLLRDRHVRADGGAGPRADGAADPGADVCTATCGWDVDADNGADNAAAAWKTPDGMHRGKADARLPHEYGYNAYPACGTDGDDDDFSSIDMCCVCGGSTPRPPHRPPHRRLLHPATTWTMLKRCRLANITN